MTIGGKALRRLRTSAVVTVLGASAPLTAQSTPAASAGLPQGSLIQKPQAGATPRVLAPSPALPSAPSVARPVTSVTPFQAVPSSPGFPAALPAASAEPLHLDLASDPVLQLARASSPAADFHQAIGAAVARNPAIEEAEAQRDKADAARDEARARQLPVADLGVSSYRVISRAVANDPDNALEHLRPHSRTDATIRTQQPVIDFGASQNRVRASDARREAAAANIGDVARHLAQRAISARCDVHGYRAIVRLGQSFAASQRALRAQVEDRVAQGAAAPGDVAQAGIEPAKDTRP